MRVPPNRPHRFRVTASPTTGEHDFDFHIGSWATHLDRLQAPLTGSDRWLSYDGTTVVHRVWDGRANLVELNATGAAGTIAALSLRLYNSTSGQWSLNSSSVGLGTLFPPAFGGFTHGRGEFYGQETLNGRSILVRFVIRDITEISCRFEQSFSTDGGRSWELNWIATDTRTEFALVRPSSLMNGQS